MSRTGRGITELYYIPVRLSDLLFFPFLGLIRMLQAEKVDMLIGSVTIGLSSYGGFCGCSRTVVDHQVPLLSLCLAVAHRR